MKVAGLYRRCPPDQSRSAADRPNPAVWIHNSRLLTGFPAIETPIAGPAVGSLPGPKTVSPGHKADPAVLPEFVRLRSFYYC